MFRRITGFVAAALISSLTGPLHSQAPSPTAYDPIVFALQFPEGLKFVTDPSRIAKKHQPETMVSGVALFDYDNDGRLDVYAVNGAFIPSLEKNDERYYNRLFRNNGDGTFLDVTEKAFHSSLFDNQRNGTFKEVGEASFVAYTDAGRAVSGMGADARDVDNDGLPDVFETALVGETMPLYRNNGGMGFEERTFNSALASIALRKSGWGNGIVDFNNDGRKDLFAACGDVMDAEGYFGPRVPQSNAVFVNMRNGRFADANPTAGQDFERKAVHRGAAFGDLDNDGRVDEKTASRPSIRCCRPRPGLPNVTVLSTTGMGRFPSMRRWIPRRVN